MRINHFVSFTISNLQYETKFCTKITEIIGIIKIDIKNDLLSDWSLKWRWYKSSKNTKIFFFLAGDKFRKI